MSATIKQGKLEARSARAMPGVGSMRPVPGGGQMGDPGIFGDIWGGIKGAVGGAIKGFTGGGSQPKPPTITWPMTIPGIQQAPIIKSPGVRGVAERLVPGGATGYEMNPAMRAGKPSQTGYHWNKTGYFLKDGTWVAPGTKEVKNRRRNPLNPRALDRSISRITSAKRASKKLSRVTIRKATACK